MAQSEAAVEPTAAEASPETIIVRDLVKSYGSIRAVDGVSFSVSRGQIFALLGPNGAGKTTTVEILEGYRKPDAGTARVLGYDPIAQGHAMKERIGLMLQDTDLYGKIKVGEAIDLFRSFYSHPQDAGSLLALVGLESHRGAFFENLSGGQKQRLSFALALAGNPEVAFLDEPTAAMDPQMRHQTWDIIRGLRTQGVTILLTTHYMEEAQRLADQVAIMDHGRLLAMGTPEDLMAGSAHDIVTFRAPAGVDLRTFQGLPSVVNVREERPGLYAITTTDALDTVGALSGWHVRTGTPIEGLRVSGATLEDIFLNLTGTEVRD